MRVVTFHYLAVAVRQLSFCSRQLMFQAAGGINSRQQKYTSQPTNENMVGCGISIAHSRSGSGIFNFLIIKIFGKKTFKKGILYSRIMEITYMSQSLAVESTPGLAPNCSPGNSAYITLFERNLNKNLQIELSPRTPQEWWVD